VKTVRWGTAAAAVALALAACSDRSGTPEDASVEADAPSACWGTETLDTFFGLSRIHDVEITVAGPGMDSLTEEPRRYTHGSVTIDGCTYHDVGVRLKGGAGSFVPIGGTYPEISDDGNGRPGKNAFIVDFNRFVSGTNHIGLEKLTINNAVQDPSFIHETLGYALFREAGVPASRTGYALVTLNGELKGLYVLVEPTDDDQFLERFYGSDAGNLYEGVYGADFEEPPGPEMEWFEQDNGSDTSMSDLRALVDDLDAIGPSDDALDVLESHFDVDEVLAFAVTELYLGH
jgi:spore coat protein CotH